MSLKFKTDIETTGLRIGTSSTAGHALVADASGNATFQAISKTFRTVHTYAITGEITNGQSVPSFFFSKTAGQTSSVILVRAKIASGTSVGVQITKNGANQGSVITVTPTATTTDIADISLADGDELDIVTSSATGTPTELSFTLIVEHTV